MTREELAAVVLAGEPYLWIDEVVERRDVFSSAINLRGRVSVNGQTTTELQWPDAR